jgi:hypothetical protein
MAASTQTGGWALLPRRSVKRHIRPWDVNNKPLVIDGLWEAFGFREHRRAERDIPQGSLLTRRWREPDSNHWSRSCERLIWALPIGDGGTKGGATYRFRSETAMLAWSGCP